MTPSPRSSTSIRLQACAKTFADGTQALVPIDLDISGGETLVLLGPSGCGKTTTLRIIAGLETPDPGGRVLFGDDDVTALPIELRNVGMVFQSFNPFPHLTVLDNCTLAPIWVLKMAKKDAQARAMEYLERVRIPEQANKYPGQLSGGQQQRVAIARALANDPDILIGDEITGDLDSVTGFEVMDLVARLNRERGTTVVYVTHDPRMAKYAGRLIQIRDGKIISDKTGAQAETAPEDERERPTP